MSEYETKENAWAKRNVDYEYLHDIRSEDYCTLLSCIGLRPGIHIADLMCGYGAVTGKIAEYARKKCIDGINVIASDAYIQQLRKVREHIRQPDPLNLSICVG